MLVGITKEGYKITSNGDTRVIKKESLLNALKANKLVLYMRNNTNGRKKITIDDILNNKVSILYRLGYDDGYMMMYTYGKKYAENSWLHGDYLYISDMPLTPNKEIDGNGIRKAFNMSKPHAEHKNKALYRSGFINGVKDGYLAGYRDYIYYADLPDLDDGTVFPLEDFD